MRVCKSAPDLCEASGKAVARYPECGTSRDASNEILRAEGSYSWINRVLTPLSGSQMNPTAWLLVLVVAAVAAQTPTDVRVCPAEPIANSTCPSECSRCEGSVCIIENPGLGVNVVCPTGLSCKVLCFFAGGLRSGCQAIIVNCPRDASCDLVCTSGSCELAYMNCPAGGRYSCSAQCDSASAIGTFRCDNATACNCNQACPTLNQVLYF